MIFPLGLGLDFPRLPVVTLALALGLIGYFAIDLPDSRAVARDTSAIFVRQHVPEMTAALLTEYCLGAGGAPAACASIAGKVDCAFRQGGKCEAKPLPKSTKLDEVLKIGQIVQRFTRTLKQHPEEMAGLKAYPAYRQARERSEQELGELQRDRQLFSAANPSPYALWLAQFKHGGFLHLFGNLVTLLVFGSYVELRIGIAAFVPIYLLGGLLGLGSYHWFFPGSPGHILGASANISALIGAFFVLFFQYRMKVWIWMLYTARTIYVPVSLFFPLYWLVSEIAGAMESGNQLYGGVAHAAHLVGFAVGAAGALLDKALRPLPWPFVYRDEPPATASLRKIADPSARLALAEKLVRHNPENIYARYTPIQEICRQPGEPSAGARAFIVRHLSACVAILRRRGKLQGICDLLETVPQSLPLNEALHASGRATLLDVGDYALETSRYAVALRVYEAYTLRFPRSANAAAVRKTIEKIQEYSQSNAESGATLRRTNGT